MGNSTSISPQEAKKLISDNVPDVILDVREKDEWNDGHHPNAVHIQLDKVEKKFHKLYPDKKTKVLIYCRSGSRASSAAQILNSQGYNNIYSVSGGGYSNLV